MADSLINNVSNVPSLTSGARAQPHPSTTTALKQSLTPVGISQTKDLSKNIETVLNKLSSKVSSDKVNAKDSDAVESIEQDIGSILSLAKSNDEVKTKHSKESASLPSESTQDDDFTTIAKQGIVDILSVASDILDSQTDAGLDESFTLSLIAELLSMLESLMGTSETGMQNGAGATSQDRFNLLIEYIDLVRDDLIETGESRFSDVISLVDQQLEEQRYRDRESMKGLSQADYIKRKGGTG